MTINKSPSNTSIKDATTGDKVEVGTKLDAVTKGLHVIAESTVAGSVAPVVDGTKYNVEFSRTDITLINTGTGTQIFQYTGAGNLEAFILHLEDKNTDILLFIDGAERYDIDCRVFDDMNFKHGTEGAYPTAYAKDEKTFKHYTRFPMKFNTSFEIRARANGKKVKGYVVNFEEV